MLNSLVPVGISILIFNKDSKMKSILLSLVICISLLFWSCESATSSIGDGTKDTVFIKDGSPRIAWGATTDGVSLSKEEVWFELICNASSLDEIPTAYINTEKADIDGADVDDIIMGELEFEVDKKFKVNDTINFKTIVSDDTLSSFVVVPPRISGLKYNGLVMPDTANENYSNTITLPKDSKSITFTWDVPPTGNKAKVYGYISYYDVNKKHYDFNFDTLIAEPSYVFVFPVNLDSLSYSSFGYTLTNTEIISSGDSPHIQTKKQNLYKQVEGPDWNFSIEIEE